MMPERLLTVLEVATILRVSKTMVSRHSGAKAVAPVLPCVQIGGRKLYREADVKQFIEDCLVRASDKVRRLA